MGLSTEPRAQFNSHCTLSSQSIRNLRFSSVCNCARAAASWLGPPQQGGEVAIRAVPRIASWTRWWRIASQRCCNGKRSCKMPTVSGWSKPASQAAGKRIDPALSLMIPLPWFVCSCRSQPSHDSARVEPAADRWQRSLPLIQPLVAFITEGHPCNSEATERENDGKVCQCCVMGWTPS